MKKTFLLLLAGGLAIGTSGCKTFITDTKDRMVIGTQRTVGIQLGQSPADQIPSLKFGLVTTTFRMIPVSTNQLYAAPVTDSWALHNSGFTTDNDEDFSTLPSFVPPNANVGNTNNWGQDWGNRPQGTNTVYVTNTVLPTVAQRAQMRKLAESMAKQPRPAEKPYVP